MNSFFAIAVNVFFLISGYFTIKSSIKKILKLIGEVLGWSTLIYMIYILTALDHFNVIECLEYTIFSANKYWFVIVYLALMLVAPYLNIVLERIKNDESLFKRLLLVLFIVTCIYGFVFDSSSLGVNGGYSLISAIFLYFVGNYIRTKNLKIINVYLNLFIYFFSALINWVLVVILMKRGYGSYGWKLYSYNNPLLVVEAVSLLLLFVRLGDIGMIGEQIAKLGKYTFAVYVIHSSQLIQEWRFIILKNALGSINVNFRNN